MKLFARKAGPAPLPLVPVESPEPVIVGLPGRLFGRPGSAITAANQAVGPDNRMMTGPVEVGAPGDDNVTNVREPQHRLGDLGRPDADGFNMFRAPRLTVAHRAATFAVAFTLRPFDKWAADTLTGMHGVIARQDGTPFGSQLPIGGAFRSVFRPVPQAWDTAQQLDQSPTPAPVTTGE